MQPIRVKTVQESDLRMLGSLARNIQRVLPVTQADIDAAAALGEGWVVWKVFEVSEPLDNMRGGTQLIIRQNSIQPGQNVRRVIFVSGPGGQTVVIRGSDYIVLPDAIADSLSYVKAFGGTEQRNLPDNYIERQFIYMMDGSYLAVENQSITSDYKIEFDFATTNLSSSLGNYFGARASGVAAGGGFRVTKLYNQGVAMYGFDTTDAYESGANILTANTRYKYVYENGTCKLSSGGTDVLTHTYTVNDTSTITAFGINAYTSNGTTYSASGLGIYCYGLKIWNGQGESVMNLVPAVQKGTVPVVGFYDTVSKTFMTATAGTFAAGGEAVPTPDTPMDIISNNGVLKARHQSGLPLGYTLLDYVETDGNSYIDTNLLLSNTSEFEITFQSADATLNTPVMGAISGGTSFTSTNNLCVTYTVASGLNAYSVYCNGAAGDANESWYAGDARDKLKHTVKYNGLNIAPTLDGVDMEQLVPTTLTTNTPTVTTWLFGRNNTGSGTKTQTGVRIYDFNVVGTAHFVPCKNASNVIGMYDLVSGQFFTNVGTGDFVAGTAVSDPVEIYTDGTVETINVHGKNLFDKSTVSTVAPGTFRSDFIRVVPGVEYSMSARGASVIIEYDSEQTQLRTLYIGVATYTPSADAVFAKFNVMDAYLDTFQIERGSTATDYEPYFNGGTATAEMLLKVGDYQDVQSIIDGVVTRNIGVKVLDGTENWSAYTQAGKVSYRTSIGNASTTVDPLKPVISTHFVYKQYAWTRDVDSISFDNMANNILFIRCLDYGTTQNVTGFKQWLADQYAAGTPVIIVYPLATATTKTVTGQTLQVTDGDNVLEITQASLNNLELEAQYQASVSLTIQEVQDANLDPNVEVTII